VSTTPRVSRWHAVRLVQLYARTPCGVIGGRDSIWAGRSISRRSRGATAELPREVAAKGHGALIRAQRLIIDRPPLHDLHLYRGVALPDQLLDPLLEEGQQIVRAALQRLLVGHDRASDQDAPEPARIVGDRDGDRFIGSISVADEAVEGHGRRIAAQQRERRLLARLDRRRIAPQAGGGIEVEDPQRPPRTGEAEHAQVGEQDDDEGDGQRLDVGAPTEGDEELATDHEEDDRDVAGDDDPAVDQGEMDDPTPVFGERLRPLFLDEAADPCPAVPSPLATGSRAPTARFACGELQ